MTKWIIVLVFFSAGVCWYFSQNWMACLSVGLIGSSFSFTSLRRIFLIKLKKGFFVELQFFLVRSRILPEDYKIVRTSILADLGATET